MKCKKTEELLAQFVFGEVDDRTAHELREHLAECDACRRVADDLRATVGLLQQAFKNEPAPVLDAEHRSAIQAAATPVASEVADSAKVARTGTKRSKQSFPSFIPRLPVPVVFAAAAAVLALFVLAGLVLRPQEKARRHSVTMARVEKTKVDREISFEAREYSARARLEEPRSDAAEMYDFDGTDVNGDELVYELVPRRLRESQISPSGSSLQYRGDPAPAEKPAGERQLGNEQPATGKLTPPATAPRPPPPPPQQPQPLVLNGSRTVYDTEGDDTAFLSVPRHRSGAKSATQDDAAGPGMTLENDLDGAVADGNYRSTLDFSEAQPEDVRKETAQTASGAVMERKAEGLRSSAAAAMPEAEEQLGTNELMVASDVADIAEDKKLAKRDQAKDARIAAEMAEAEEAPEASPPMAAGGDGNEEFKAGWESLGIMDEPVEQPVFKALPVNPFVLTDTDRFSTFSLGTDTASYGVARNYLIRGQLPPPQAVRMEEFVNYFDYNYPRQQGKTFSVHAEAGPAPFGKNLVLLKIGVQGRIVGREGRKPAHQDAKIQVAFDPARVRRYRLIGYENRDIADEDFRNDAVDAGEVGSGQAATALYEIELVNGDGQTQDALPDLGTVYVRYRDLDLDEIEEISTRLKNSLIEQRTPQDSPRFFLAACAAEFAEILRGSEHARDASLATVEFLLQQVAVELSLDDKVQELLMLVRRARQLSEARK